MRPAFLFEAVPRPAPGRRTRCSPTPRCAALDPGLDSVAQPQRARRLRGRARAGPRPRSPCSASACCAASGGAPARAPSRAATLGAAAAAGRPRARPARRGRAQRRPDHPRPASCRWSPATPSRSCPPTPGLTPVAVLTHGPARRLLRPRARRRRRPTAAASALAAARAGAARLPRRRRPRHVAAAPRSRPPGVDPLAPEAPLAFVFSPLVGTPLTTSAKFAVVAKSPLTGLLNDALASSHFAIAGKLTGHDAIVVRGACDEPSVLLVDGDGARLEPAGDLWGLSGRGGRGAAARAARPGVAGRVDRPGRRARRRATPRSPTTAATPAAAGSGAVLGAKQLKAVAVRAATKVAPADPQARARRRARPARSARSGPATAKYRELGTLANLLAFNALSTLPTRNFQAATFDEAPRLAAEDLAEARGVARDSCASCSIGCEHIYSGAGRAGRRAWSTRTSSRSGRCAGSPTPTPCSRPARRCDELGLDTISAGGTIAWAMECAERGLLDAPWLRFGDGRRAAAGARRDRRARGARRAAGRRARAPPRAQRRAGLRGVRRRTSRASSCPATSRARCRRWRSGSPSTPAAPTTTARAPTRPTSPGDLDRLAGGAAARRRRDRDRGPRGGHGLADPVQVPARRLRRPVRRVGAAAALGHRLGRRRPPSCAATARRIVLAKRAFNLREGWTPRRRLAARALPRREPLELASGRDGARSRRERLRAMIDGYYAARGLDRQAGADPASAHGSRHSPSCTTLRSAQEVRSARPWRSPTPGTDRDPHRHADHRRPRGHRARGHDDLAGGEGRRHRDPGALPRRALRPGRRLPHVRRRRRRARLRGVLRAPVRGRHGGQDRPRRSSSAAARRSPSCCSPTSRRSRRTRRRPRPPTTSCSCSSRRYGVGTATTALPRGRGRGDRLLQPGHRGQPRRLHPLRPLRPRLRRHPGQRRHRPHGQGLRDPDRLRPRRPDGRVDVRHVRRVRRRLPDRAR